jgi:hypothetical protein
MMFTDVYEVFFEGLMVVALTPAWFVVEWCVNREPLARRLHQWSRRGLSDLALSSPFFLFWLLPFFAVYYPVFRQTGGRPYPEVFAYMRDWRELLNVGPDNWLWGPSLGKWFQTWVSPVGEPGFGLSPIMVLFALIAPLAFFWNNLLARHSKLKPPGTLPRAIAALRPAGWSPALSSS